jgi:hypothetical protein
MALLQGLAKAGAKAIEKDVPKLIEKSAAYHATIQQLRNVADKFGFKSEEFKALWNGVSETHKMPGTEVLADVNAIAAPKKAAKVKAPTKEPSAPVKAATAKLPKVSRKTTPKPNEKLAPVAAAEGTGKKASPEQVKSDKTPAAQYRAQLRNISQMMNPDNEIPAEVLNATIEDAAKVTGRTTEQVVADVSQFTKRNNVLGETKFVEGEQAEVLRQSAVDAGVDPALAARFKFEEQKYSPSRLNQGTTENTPARTRQYRATIELTPEEKLALGNTRFAGRDDRMVEKARATGRYTVSSNTPEGAAKDLAAFHQELKAPPEAPAHPAAVTPPAEPAAAQAVPPEGTQAALPAHQAAPLEPKKPEQVMSSERPVEGAEPMELATTPKTSADLMEAQLAKATDESGLPATQGREMVHQPVAEPAPNRLGIPGKTADAEWRPKGTVDPKLAGTAALAVGATALASRAMTSGEGTSNALSIPMKQAPKPLSKEEQIAAEQNGPAPVPEITASQANKDVVRFVKTGGGNYPVFQKDSPSAIAFRAAFHAARLNGDKEFMFTGLRYTTKVA